MMTPEELDEARAKEAVRIWGSQPLASGDISAPAAIAARLAREGWTPPPAVDRDVLAYREWAFGHLGRFYSSPEDVLAGKWDRSVTAQAYLAGARMAREQEQERAKVLVDQAKAIIDQHARLLARLPLGMRADIGIEWQTMMDATASFYAALAKYRGEA